MYDPAVGQFITEDPIGFDGADTNLHRYVGNSPTNATDPSGMMFSRSLTFQEMKFFCFIFERALPAADPADIAAVLSAQLYDTTAGSTGFWDSLADNLSPYTLWARAATQLDDVTAITFGKHIYFKKLPMANSVADLPLIGHELLHSWHVEAARTGRPGWVLAYVADRIRNGYMGNLSEVAAYAMEATIKHLLQKYPNLFRMVQNGTAQQIPGISNEIRSLYLQYFKLYLQNRE